MSRTILLIHGAWLTPAAWEPFAGRLRTRGYDVLLPSWPYNDRPLAKLRAAPRPELARLTVQKIVAHYAAIVRELPEPPILIGHSFGGLFVQQLLDQGLGAAGVAIDPAAPKGVPPSRDALKGALPVFGAWASWRRTLSHTPHQFAFAFVNTLDPGAQQAAYEAFTAPTPGRIYWQSALGLGTEVDFSGRRRQPLLLVAGGRDQTVSQSMVEAVYERHRRSGAPTDHLVFPDRPHLLIATPGWQEVADAALDWVGRRFPSENAGVAQPTVQAA